MVKVEWTFHSDRYWYISHALNDVKYSDYTDDVPPANLFMYRYPKHWSRITSDDASLTGLSGNERRTEGYAVKQTTGSDVTISYSGLLRTGTYSYEFDRWELLSNPYQSYLDLEKLKPYLGSTANEQVIWTAVNPQDKELYYTAYDLREPANSVNATQYVAPGQSFWLLHNGTSTVSFTPEMRSTADQNPLKSANYVSDNVLRLTLINNDAVINDVAVMNFKDKASLEELSKSDINKKIGSANVIPNIYTVKGGNKLIIGYYPEDMNSDTIHLGYKFGSAKSITLRASNISEFWVQQDVYLYDKKEDVEINLRETPEYTFTSVAGGEDDRFVLYFTKTDVPTDIEVPGTVEGGTIQIYGYMSKGIVNVSEDVLLKAGNKGIIRVYTALGSLVKEVKLIDSRITVDLPATHGVYIIEVRAGDMVKTGKISVTK
jgi:hypothetical protein